MTLDFEWDDNKNKTNIKKHQIRFEAAIEIFKKPVFTWLDTRYDYGEVRKISVGELSELAIITVVYTERNNKYRIISVRKANFKERKTYYEYIKSRN